MMWAKKGRRLGKTEIVKGKCHSERGCLCMCIVVNVYLQTVSQMLACVCVGWVVFCLLSFFLLFFIFFYFFL
jgi:hypothetical protein